MCGPGCMQASIVSSPAPWQVLGKQVSAEADAAQPCHRAARRVVRCMAPAACLCSLRLHGSCRNIYLMSLCSLHAPLLPVTLPQSPCSLHALHPPLFCPELGLTPAGARTGCMPLTCTATRTSRFSCCCMVRCAAAALTRPFMRSASGLLLCSMCLTPVSSRALCQSE